MWSWADEHGTWHNYKQNDSQGIEAAFSDSRQQQVPLCLSANHPGSPSHAIDLNNMEQVNVRSHFRRPVRREPDEPLPAGAWCFQEKDGRWIVYDAATSGQVSAAKAAGRSSTVIYVFHTHQMWAYHVDLQNNVQINTVTSMQRPIRFDQQAAAPPPKHPARGGSSGGAFHPQPQYRNLGAGVPAMPANSSLPAELQPPWRRTFTAVSSSNADLATLTKWTIVTGDELQKLQASGVTDPIMMTDLGEEDEEVVRLPCHCEGGAVSCIFNKGTVEQAFQSGQPACPVCGTKYGLPGPQPTGRMECTLEPNAPCAGHEHTAQGSLVIEYSFHDGIQQPQHPKPGQPYRGTRRTAILPNDDVGHMCLALLVKAFDQGLLFRVGNSSTTGREDVVVWAIHQKTSQHGGPTNHGWPDPEYIQRLKSECAAAGVVGALD